MSKWGFVCVFSFQDHYTISHALASLGAFRLWVGKERGWFGCCQVSFHLRCECFDMEIIYGRTTTLSAHQLLLLPLLLLLPAGLLVCLVSLSCKRCLPAPFELERWRRGWWWTDEHIQQITVCILWNSTSTHHPSAYLLLAIAVWLANTKTHRLYQNRASSSLNVSCVGSALNIDVCTHTPSSYQGGRI